MKDDAAEAGERVRALVEAVVLVPENGRLQIELRGELAAILSRQRSEDRRRGHVGTASQDGCGDPQPILSTLYSSRT